MTQKQEIGYKVLKHSRESCVMAYSNMPANRFAGRKYPRGTRITPNTDCGPLCVFDSYKHAKAWSSPLSKIVKCNYVPSSHKHVWELLDFFAKIPLCALPNHTVLADSVTCLE